MTNPRARDLGIRIGTMEPGPMNSITDVAGVGVGHRTLIGGSGSLRVGVGPVRTGVTVVVPRESDPWADPVFAGAHRLNGNGEMTGLEWVRESGLLTSPIGITNTHSVGAVHEGLVRFEVGRRGATEPAWALPVVAETWDGRLNDINGFHVRPAHAEEALAAVSRGPVAEGSVGGGTGMVAFGFKAGIGSASRVVTLPGGGSNTVGVLVQANYGRRERLTVAGVPVGRFISADTVPLPETDVAPDPPSEGGSVIVIVATDAPLLPHQCERLAQRVSIGIGRTGGAGGNFSGDLFLSFATGNTGLAGARDPADRVGALEMVADDDIDGFFHAVIEATEEAVLNSMLAADTMTGRDGITAHGLPRDELVRVLRAGWFPLDQG